ncbi:MAG: transglycosylase SLT domain-containing protein [Gemmatimonadaceae bacterium]
MRRVSCLVALTAALAAGCVRSGAAPVITTLPARGGTPSTATNDATPSDPASARPRDEDVTSGSTRQGKAASGSVAATGTSGAAATRSAAARAAGGDTSRAVADSVSASDVTRETARMFGAEAPPPVTDTMAAPGAPVWDIDVRSYETRARVEEYVRIFSGRAKGTFEVALQRQTRYGPMIRERLRRIGLPEDMIYLALVESWFNPHAYSRAAAVGMWQFMAGTGRGMGLRVDWWMDERRDPVRSTEAAARLLQGLREQFGSLYLAAAAYNGGSGRVSRGLARHADALDGVEGEDRFFALAEQSYLRPETRDYVPKIIAAALVAGEPARYGVRVEPLAPYAYDSVRTPGGTPLAAVANAAGVPADSVSELNPHVLRGMTPPGDSLWVRVPLGRATGFDERFTALEPDERRALNRIVSKKGQTMLSIAKKHGVTSKQLAWYNPKVVKLKSGALRVGQTIYVPRRDVVAMARDIPNPSVERYPRRSTSGGIRRHVVRSGETLSGIAKRYGTSARTLTRLNGLKSSKIIPGQSLVVSARAAATAKKSAPKASAATSSVKKPAVKKPAVKKPPAR